LRRAPAACLPEVTRVEHENTQEFWERLYSERAQVWRGRVNAALERKAGGLTPGRALDLGCGDGGDALWLAERGWQVTAIDIAQTALDRGAAEAARRGLVVDWQCADLAEQLPRGPYELVSAQFLQSPVALPRIEILRLAAAEVARGGALLMPTAAEVVAQLSLPEVAWDAVRAEEVVRVATGPDGQPAELVDTVVLLRRR
jgi:2-polyprenyl-3-methyl-5-hydroxy-6-metoxy-1,4-benzoquinol methylase